MSYWELKSVVRDSSFDMSELKVIKKKKLNVGRTCNINVVRFRDMSVTFVVPVRRR
jgi:hypothetical protein